MTTSRLATYSAPARCLGAATAVLWLSAWLAMLLTSGACPPAVGGEPMVANKSATSPLVSRTSAVEPVLRQAVDYLWRQQSSDGGWHSETYALMRSGQALTPFVLAALLDAGADARDPRVEKALEFVRRHTSADGALGLADSDILEYPVYSTSYALYCLVRAGGTRDATLIARMAIWLSQMQFHEGAGYAHEQPVFGGWGFGGPRSPDKPGHMDLAHTRRALQALAAAGRLESPARRDALVFLQRMQRLPSTAAGPHSAIAGATGLAPPDGGFYFSPVVLAANKGQDSHDPSTVSRSYATATCDGALALLAAGCNLDDKRVAAARTWLIEHPRWDSCEGIPIAGNPWGRAVFFYHLAVRAEASARLNLTGHWRHEAARLLAAEQRPDGGFCNRQSSLMKEDDPLLATALATIALTHVQR